MLLDKLKQTENSRVINVASGAHQFVKDMNFDDLQSEKTFKPLQVYGQSKLANILFTKSLSEKLLNSGVTVNCLHPGVVNTNIANNNEKLYYKIITSVIKYFSISAKEGAQTSIYLATNDLVSNVTGLYFKNCRPIKTSKVSYDEKVALELWKKSKRILEKISA